MSVVTGQLEDCVTEAKCKTLLIKQYFRVGDSREIHAEKMKTANKHREGIKEVCVHS